MKTWQAGIHMFCFLMSGSDEKLAVCKDLGADVCINYKTEDFVTRVKAETGGKGILFSVIAVIRFAHQSMLPPLFNFKGLMLYS